MGPHLLALTALRTLTVLVYDHARVSDASINEMETVSSAILSDVSIRAQWVHCLGHQQGARPALCEGKLGAATVQLRILLVYPGNRTGRGEALGTAVVGGTLAKIYAFPIYQYACRNSLPASRLMAYAATHEFGHLLLGPQHSPSGIMQGAWGTTEYRAMAQRRFGFSEAQQEALRRAVPAADQRLAGLL